MVRGSDWGVSVVARCADSTARARGRRDKLRLRSRSGIPSGLPQHPVRRIPSFHRHRGSPLGPASQRSQSASQVLDFACFWRGESQRQRGRNEGGARVVRFAIFLPPQSQRQRGRNEGGAFARGCSRSWALRSQRQRGRNEGGAIPVRSSAPAFSSRNVNVEGMKVERRHSNEECTEAQESQRQRGRNEGGAAPPKVRRNVNVEGMKVERIEKVERAVEAFNVATSTWKE
jgi:hypothetical protein